VAESTTQNGVGCLQQLTPFHFGFSASDSMQGKGRDVCGPSSEQKLTEGQQQHLTSLMTADYNQRFGQQSDIINNMMRVYTPIVQAGPDQQGMGANELAALKTQAGEAVGNNYAKAGRSLNNQLAARGGGNEFLPSGADANLRGQLAEAGAAQQSSEDLAITRANYELGRQNWQHATAGLNALVGETNPTAYGQMASSSNQAAFGQATEIQKMENQKEADIAGGITSLAMGAATFGAGALGGVGGVKGFAGGLKALTGVSGGSGSSVYGMDNPEAVG
jgi:hypothetical protein